MENLFIYRELRSEFDKYSDDNGNISDMKAQRACWKFGIYPSTSQIYEIHVCHCEKISKCFHGLQFYEFCLLVATIKNAIFKDELKPGSETECPFVKWPQNLLRKSKKPRWDVFLGGACNPTTWRFDVAIPFLKEKNITFYNPQVSEWDSSLIEIEEIAKQSARVLFFVLDIRRTRGIASLVEAAFLSGQGRNLVLVLPAEVPEKKEEIEVKELDETEFQSIHRSYLFIADLVQRQGIPIFTNTVDALRATRASLISNRMVQELTEIDGVIPVKHSFVNVSITIRTLQSIFNCLDTSKKGAITYRDAKQGMSTILGKRIFRSTSNFELISSADQKSTFTFPEFCIEYAVILLNQLHHIRQKTLQADAALLHISASVEDMKHHDDYETSTTQSVTSWERQSDKLSHVNSKGKDTNGLRRGLRSANSTLISSKQERVNINEGIFTNNCIIKSTGSISKLRRNPQLPALHIPSPVHQIVQSNFTYDNTQNNQQPKNDKSKKPKSKFLFNCFKIFICCKTTSTTTVGPSDGSIDSTVNDLVTTKLDSNLGQINETFLKDPDQPNDKVIEKSEDDDADDDDDRKKYDIFLGGTCGDSNWRERIAIPLLRKNGCTFYDPQIAHSSWTRRLLPMEAEARANSKVLVYVITNESTSTAALVEAAHFIGQGKKVVLHVQFLVSGGYSSPPMTPMAHFLQSSCSFPLSSNGGGILEAAEVAEIRGRNELPSNDADQVDNRFQSTSSGFFSMTTPASSLSPSGASSTAGILEGSSKQAFRSQSTQRKKSGATTPNNLVNTKQQSQLVDNHETSYFSELKPISNKLSTSDTGRLVTIDSSNHQLSSTTSSQVSTQHNKHNHQLDLGFSMNNISKINPLPPEASKDHNRGRKYLIDIANRAKIPVFPTIDETINHAILLSQTSLNMSPFHAFSWSKKMAAAAASKSSDNI